MARGKYIPYVPDQPWFHEVARPDGSPYRQAEVDLMRQLTGKHQKATR